VSWCEWANHLTSLPALSQLLEWRPHCGLLCDRQRPQFLPIMATGQLSQHWCQHVSFEQLLELGHCGAGDNGLFVPQQLWGHQRIQVTIRALCLRLPREPRMSGVACCCPPCSAGFWTTVAHELGKGCVFFSLAPTTRLGLNPQERCLCVCVCVCVCVWLC
jgi:hypothetical protein